MVCGVKIKWGCKNVMGVCKHGMRCKNEMGICNGGYVIGDVEIQSEYALFTPIDIIKPILDKLHK